ncbi:response regulator transcription factor [Carboxydochorda subterranea]|uniref:Response regulator transcription factor n=1 Tax=Carboxydichorda subterranea TaxID=3109565 RepID=A0ABZ1BU42_9FIRM|nr:response regulator transcription factor [Limnochorda sp. L945t]WRP16113.1 response regulator transcription factor [Limnochorda sp. L945t]
MTRILLAEDDESSARLLEKYLTARGYRVVRAEDGRMALQRFLEVEPDLVLLDVRMPEMDGWTVLSEIRSLSNVPIIMVTVHNQTTDKVRGLTGGADDYVTKPFDLPELAARIEAVIRRHQGAPQPAGAAAGGSTAAAGGAGSPAALQEATPAAATEERRWQAGSLVVDDRRKEVWVRGRRLHLSRKEYEVLSLLVQEPGRVYSTEEIVQRAWPERSDATAEDVKKYVYLLRSKIEAHPERPVIIETVRGFGYRVAPDTAPDPPPASGEAPGGPAPDRADEQATDSARR